MKRLRVLGLLLVVIAGVAGERGASAQPPPLVAVQLVAGWNHVAYLGPTAPVGQVVAPLGVAVRSVWEFDAASQTWRGYDARSPQASDLATLGSHRAIWLLMRERATLMFASAGTTPQISLYPGTNNIVYNGGSISAMELLTQLGPRVRGIWRWDATGQRWQAAVAGAPQASEFTVLIPGQAYSIQVAPATAAGSSTTATRPDGPMECYRFQSRQPSLTEVRGAFNRAGFGTLQMESGFSLPQLETEPGGDGGLVAGYVPPTLLKAIGWTESSWRQAEFAVERGGSGRTLFSTSCAYGLMQVLTAMNVVGTPTPRQQRIGSEYIDNIAAGARMLAEKWNLAPADLPVVRPRSPRTLEDWYYAVWAYHCWGETCTIDYGLHDHPDDPVLTWPRPAYNSPEQLSSQGRFSRSDYPYQELVYGLVLHPPRADGEPLWTPLPIALPRQGTVGYPTPRAYDRPGTTTDPTRATDP